MDGNAKSRVSDALYYLDQIHTLDDRSNLAATVRSVRRDLRAAMTSSPSATLSTGASDSLIKLLRDMETKARIAPNGLSDEYAKRLKRLVGTDGGPVPGRTSEAKPEVVTGEDAKKLPAGSIVIRCAYDGTPYTSDPDIEPGIIGRGGYNPRHFNFYRVLDRAPEKPVKVGDVITGRRAMTLPTGSIVLRNSWPVTKVGSTYRNGPGGTDRSVIDDDRDLTVLYLPEGN